MARGLALVIGVTLSAGCGRIAFDPIGPGGADDANDATTSGLMPACPIGTTAPSTITISGQTVSVSTFGSFTNEPDVTINILGAVGGSVLATTTSDTNGNFSVLVPTSGKPLVPFMRAEKASLMTTSFVPDQPTDGDFSTGPAYMSSFGSSDSLYLLGGVTRDSARGTLLVMVEDCAGTEITGATIAITPAPQKVIYSGPLGAPNANATSTGAYGRVWALNVLPGTITISASKAGMTFPDHTAEILPGDVFSGTPIRPQQ